MNHVVLYQFEGKTPKVGEKTYISQSAEVIGNVTIGKQCYLGPGAKVRGDYGRILIGNRTCIEENCVLHARPGEICEVGSMVTLGHGSILHNCTVKDYAVIGMGAIVSDYAVVGVWSVVGEGCIVMNKQTIEDHKISVGVPARIVGEVSKNYQELDCFYKDKYTLQDIDREHLELSLFKNGRFSLRGKEDEIGLEKRFRFSNTNIDVYYTIKNNTQNNINVWFGSELNLSFASNKPEDLNISTFYSSKFQR